jgi:hypothetical protein
MSSAHAPDAHDDHAFTGEPVQVLSPDEPRTPGWIPLLGLALFTAAAVAFLAGSGSPDAAKAGASASAAPSPVADTPRPPPANGAAPGQPPPRPAGAPGQPPRPAAAPGAPGAVPGQPLTPEQRQQMMKQLGRAKPPAGH